MSIPFMQLYVADYLGDTQHLTTEQHGAYLLILMAMWRAGGSLPSDPVRLARIARTTPARWRKIGGEVLAFFETHDGLLTQRRLRREIEKASDISRKRAQAGARGAAAKQLKGQGADPANDGGLPAHNQNPDSNATHGNGDATGSRVFPTSALLETIPGTPGIGSRVFPTSAFLETIPGTPGIEAIRQAIAEAGGAALAPRALADLSPLLGWLAAGADLAADVLPVIEARSDGKRRGSVRSLAYFAEAVAEARERKSGVAELRPQGAGRGAIRETGNGRRESRRSAHDVLAAGMARAIGAHGDGEGGGRADPAAGRGADAGDESVARGRSGTAPAIDLAARG